MALSLQRLQLSSLSAQRQSLRRISRKDSRSGTGDVLITVPPDGGWGWIVVIASFITAFLSDGMILTYGLFINYISEDFQMHPTRVAIASSVLTGFNYLWGPVICGLVNRYGFRLIACIGAITCSVTFLLASIVLNFPLFVLVYGVVGGLAFGMIYVPSLLVVTYYFERWRALAVSISVCGSALGVTCYPLFTSNMIELFSWRTSFQVLSSAGIPCALCALTYRPLKPVKLRGVVLDDNTTAESFSFYRPLNERPMIEGAFLAADLSIPQIKLNSSSSFVISILQESSQSVVPDYGPHIAQSPSTTNPANRCCCKSHQCNFCRNCNCCRNAMRPMYRNDIFFTGSLYTIPEYATILSSMQNAVKKSTTLVDYHLSVTRVATQRDLTESHSSVSCCPQALKSTVSTMLDFSLCKSPSFCILILSGFFSVFGMYVPYIYVMERAQEKQMDATLSAYLLSVLGLANCVGRIVCGVISSFPRVQILFVSYATLLVCGVTAIVSVYLTSVYGQYVFCAVYGVSLASLPCLKAPLIVEMIGLERLTNALGVIMMFQGVASLLSLPVAGLVYKLSNTYDSCFLLTGVWLILGGVVLMPIKLVARWENARHQAQS